MLLEHQGQALIVCCFCSQKKLSGNQTYGLLENPQKDHPRELCERQRGFCSTTGQAIHIEFITCIDHVAASQI